MINVSVIIPTRNRANVLKMTLNSLEHQTLSQGQYEVIVIDDGSEPTQQDQIITLVKKCGRNFRLLTQKHLGPAAARNLGIKKALGQIVLIINDDTIPTRNLLERHLLFHQANPLEIYGLLGKVTWSKKISITPFMRWLENGGPYFSFNSIRGKIAGWQRLWCCNVSFKKSLLLKRGIFDEDFTDASWEDIELGYRLHHAGMVLHYDPGALGYHHHPTSIATIKNKMFANGKNLWQIRKKIPPEHWPPLAKNPDRFILLDAIMGLGLLAWLTRKLSPFFDRLNFGGPLFDLVLLHYRIEGFKSTS